jgi:hypothetical protein
MVGQMIGHRVVSTERMGEGQVRVLTHVARGDVRSTPQRARRDLGDPEHVVEDKPTIPDDVETDPLG